MEVEKDLASMMRREYCLRSWVAVLEGDGSDAQVRASDSDQGHRVERVGMRGTPQLLRSEHRRFQAARHTGVPVRAAERERWMGAGSRDQPLRLIPIGDVVRDPESDDSYVEAPEEEGGITEMSNDDVDKVIGEASASN